MLDPNRRFSLRALAEVSFSASQHQCLSSHVVGLEGTPCPPPLCYASSATPAPPPANPQLGTVIQQWSTAYVGDGSQRFYFRSPCSPRRYFCVFPPFPSLRYASFLRLRRPSGFGPSQPFARGVQTSQTNVQAESKTVRIAEYHCDRQSASRRLAATALGSTTLVNASLWAVFRLSERRCCVCSRASSRTWHRPFSAA